MVSNSFTGKDRILSPSCDRLLIGPVFCRSHSGFPWMCHSRRSHLSVLLLVFWFLLFTVFPVLHIRWHKRTHLLNGGLILTKITNNSTMSFENCFMEQKLYLAWQTQLKTDLWRICRSWRESCFYCLVTRRHKAAHAFNPTTREA